MDSIFRVFIYIDGFNFYYGQKDSNWRKYYWLNFVSFFESFMGHNQKLIKVKYFTAVPENKDKANRQDKLFQVNNENDKFDLIYGSYLKKKINCPICHNDFYIPEEKKTDVNIATSLIEDAIKDLCDISIVVSGDSDLTPPIEFLKSYKPEHLINVFFPPKRKSLHLKRIVKSTVYLEQYKAKFQQFQFPNCVELSDGYKIYKPFKWQ